MRPIATDGVVWSVGLCTDSQCFSMGLTTTKLPIFVGDLNPRSNKWFLGTTQVSTPNGISIGSAVSAGITNVTNRRTHRQTVRPKHWESVLWALCHKESVTATERLRQLAAMLPTVWCHITLGHFIFR